MHNRGRVMGLAEGRALRRNSGGICSNATRRKPGASFSLRDMRPASLGLLISRPNTCCSAPPLKLPTNVFTNNTHSPEAGAVTMILLDLLNTPSADQQYARQQLLKFLKTKTESRQFALCTLTSDRAAYLRLLQGFT